MIDGNALWSKHWPCGIPGASIEPHGKLPVAAYVKILAKQMPEKTAINFYGSCLTFSQWDEQADKLAAALADMGYKRGDPVILYMHNSPQLAIAYIATTRLGLIVFTADPSFKEFELEYIALDSGAKLVFTFDQNFSIVRRIQDRTKIRHIIVTSFWDYLPNQADLPLHQIMTPRKETFSESVEFLELLQKYRPHPPEIKIEMDEPELVLYTGGTTGRPKGCVHTHWNTLKCGAHAYQVKERSRDLSLCDSVLVYGPLGHIGALSHGFFPCCVHGRTMVMLTRFDPLTVMKAIDSYKVELSMPTVPALKSLLSHPEFKHYTLSSVKLWEVGEWMVWLTPDFAKQWEDATGTRPVKWGYGMSEIANVGPCGTRVGHEIPFKDEFLMGTVPPGELIDIKIVDFESRKELPPGKRGEIAVKSPARCAYYWNKPQETAQAFDAGGWFYTSDIGMIDEDGFLYWYGRKKFVMVVSGFQVSPGEVEMVGRRCRDIANIAVVGIRDEKRGERPKAFVQLVPESKATAAEIEEWFHGHISTYKVPQIEIRDELPLTPKGSVDMGKLLSS